MISVKIHNQVKSSCQDIYTNIVLCNLDHCYLDIIAFVHLVKERIVFSSNFKCSQLLFIIEL